MRREYNSVSGWGIQGDGHKRLYGSGARTQIVLGITRGKTDVAADRYSRSRGVNYRPFHANEQISESSPSKTRLADVGLLKVARGGAVEDDGAGVEGACAPAIL